ncbi:helix-turn-helix transcriptional regulator [Massilia violaceinigra]|uniref:Helix-turn-helix transcriptional regulator n=1 Tax=Massilia violaceinigra TaxID=2045208 RepID=A0ABY4AEN6_9BURK|nr:AraC family transcriptional regulator [Massilia violaceinigra]UOD31028.1 helix-turn-helix transcriptional regulator [Massilia violaceinigra]
MQATLISPLPKAAPARYCRQAPPLPLPLPSTDDGKGALAAWQVRQLTAHIDANLCATLRTTHLAATLGLSVSHFSRAFKNAVGVPARVYVLRRRVAAACEAMLASDEPLTHIAHAHGFCDQSHFSRAFQMLIGMGPQAWRRSQR